MIHRTTVITGWRSIRLALLAAWGVLLISGCASEHPSGPSIVQSPAFAVPPQQLVQDVQRVVSAPPISLPVENKGNGVLLTGWQGGFRGQFHIVRYWHERTRYRITIVPDFADPAHHSRIQIDDETQQRPDESGPNQEARTWHPAPDIHRPERSEALLHQMENQLGAAVVTQPKQPG